MIQLSTIKTVSLVTKSIPNGLLASPTVTPARQSTPRNIPSPYRRQQSFHNSRSHFILRGNSWLLWGGCYFLRLGCRSGRLLLPRRVSGGASFIATVTWSYSVSLLAYIGVGLDTRAIPCAEAITGRCRGCSLLAVVLFRRWAMSTVCRSASSASVRKITRVCCIPSTFLGGLIST
jgi:hypothetical protein